MMINSNDIDIIDDDDTPRPVVIRHAGRAHIRGKIRRIWRPRYLEVMDSGLVRYYECDDSYNNNYSGGFGDQPDQQHQYNSTSADEHHLHMIPKCTLQVYRARIIDVTTLRDVHVGLPHGTFGFLFHARRLVYDDICTPSDQTNQQARDFLCAVSTLEEAQSWVVALQWASWYYTQGGAAGIRNRQQQQLQRLKRQRNNGFPSNSTDHLDVDLLQDDDLYSTASTLVTGSPGLRRNHQPALVSVVTSPSRPRRANTTEAATTKSRGLAISNQNNKIVVPKVLSVHIVCTEGDFYWNATTAMAYEIQLLLLTRKADPIEERTLLRTRSQLDVLLKQIGRELLLDRNRNNSANAKSKRTLESVRIKLSESNTNSNYRAFVRNIPRIDSILRTLAMDAQICNSMALRNFWSLDDSQPQPVPSGYYSRLLPQPFGLASLPVHHTITNGESATDDFVKQWLHQKSTTSKRAQQNVSKPTEFLYNILLHQSSPILFMGCLVVVPLLLFRPLHSLFVGTLTTKPIHISLDVLLISWAVAILVGMEWEKRQGGLEKSRHYQHEQRKTSSSSGKFSPIKHNSASIENVVAGNGTDDEELLDVQSTSTDEDITSLEGDEQRVQALDALSKNDEADSSRLSSPLPKYPDHGGTSCWSKPADNMFRVRSATYLQDRVKLPSGPAPFHLRGCDLWLTDNPERHIARHPSVMGGRLADEDTFLVNFLLPFGNFVCYFGIPPIDKFPKKLANVWTKFINGDQQYRDARLKLLPVVVEGPWIVKAAVGPGRSPALLGKVIPLQYYFRHPTEDGKKGVYEVDVIITASTIAKGILSVVKGHTKALTIAFGFIIEAAEEEELPESVLCNCQIHSVDLEECPPLPHFDLDGGQDSE